MRKLFVLMVLVACGDPVDPGEARVFRDDFEPPDTAWVFSGQGARSENGMIRVSTGAGRPPSAKYTLPSPFGPGWEFEVNVGTGAGAPCPTVEISTGDSRRHGWFLQIDPGQGYWGLQVGDGADWEFVGSAVGAEMEDPTDARLLVDGESVGLWLDGVRVVDATVEGAAPNAVDITLGVARCNIIAGIAQFDWVELRELDRS